MGKQDASAVAVTGVRAGLEVAFPASPGELLLRQRTRLAARLDRLGAQGWRRATRCPLWDVADVVTHLGDATTWALAAVAEVAEVDTAAEGSWPFHEFDAGRTPHEHVLAGRGQAPELLLARMREQSAALAQRLIAAEPGVPSVRWLAAQTYTPVLAGLHILWDSWLHELDLDAALTAEGVPPEPPCPLELDAAAAYGIFFAAVVARLGFAPEEELRLHVGIGELAYDLRFGSDVRLCRAEGPPAPGALVLRGPAVATVEALAGRGELAEVAEGDAGAFALLGGLGPRMREPADVSPAGGAPSGAGSRA